MARPNEPYLGTNQYLPTPRATDQTRHTENHKNKPMRASINIATLNMNGFTAPASQMTGIEKWSAVNHTISDYKIAILALQETHLDAALLRDIDACFGKRLSVINSQDPNNPRASVGVAFVINKTLIAPKEITTYELVEGRAIAL